MSFSQTQSYNMSIDADFINTSWHHVAYIYTLFRKDLVELCIKIKIFPSHFVYAENAYRL